jgi:hypothetical protein
MRDSCQPKVQSRGYDAVAITHPSAASYVRIGKWMGRPHYTLQDWLLDWEWWTVHVIPEFLEVPSRALLEKVEAYFKVRYEDDPRWRQARMLEAWRFILDNLQNLIAENTVSVCPSGELSLHREFATTLWLYFNDEGSSAAIDRAILTPEILEEFGRLIRENLGQPSD